MELSFTKARRKSPNRNSHSRPQLIIKLPSLNVLRVLSRSMFFTLALLALPSIAFLSTRPALSPVDSLDSILRDASQQGLLQPGHNVLVLTHHPLPFNSSTLIHFVTEHDSDGQVSIPDDTFDFAFDFTSRAADFIDRVTKTGGVVALPSNKGSNAFSERSNYKIVYREPFESAFVAMRKTSKREKLRSLKGKHCTVAPEVKMLALKGLEGAMLEPPRRALGDSKRHLKTAKFLPELLGGDSLRCYRRRVFVNVDSAIGWFHEGYPTEDQEFEVYNLKTVTEESTGKIMSPPSWISRWVKENVNDDEFVVMKANAGVVEEMVKESAIWLVDELFLECESSRAYWECLALFGKLRGGGIAVHQWWG